MDVIIPEFPIWTHSNHRALIVTGWGCGLFEMQFPQAQGIGLGMLAAEGTCRARPAILPSDRYTNRVCIIYSHCQLCWDLGRLMESYTVHSILNTNLDSMKQNSLSGLFCAIVAEDIDNGTGFSPCSPPEI